MKLKTVSMVALCLMVMGSCKKEKNELIKNDLEQMGTFSLDGPSKIYFEMDGIPYNLEGNNTPQAGWSAINGGKDEYEYGTRFEYQPNCGMPVEIGKHFTFELEKGKFLKEEILDEKSWYNYIVSKNENEITHWYNEGVNISFWNSFDNTFESSNSGNHLFKVIEYKINNQNQLVVHATFNADLIDKNQKVHQLRNGRMIAVFDDLK